MNTLIIYGVVLLVVAVSSFTAGVRVESNHRDAQLLVQERAHAEAYRARVGFLRGNADAVSSKLGQQRRARQNERQEFDQKLKEAINAKHEGRCESENVGGAGAGVLRPSVNVGLWNHGLLEGTGGPSGGAGRIDGAASPAGFATIGSALANLGENADRWRECRETLMGWQDLARRNGWVGRATVAPAGPAGGGGATLPQPPAPGPAGGAGIGPK